MSTEPRDEGVLSKQFLRAGLFAAIVVAAMLVADWVLPPQPEMRAVLTSPEHHAVVPPPVASTPAPQAKPAADACSDNLTGEYRESLFRAVAYLTVFDQQLRAAQNNNLPIICSIVHTGGLLNQGAPSPRQLDQNIRRLPAPSGCEAAHASVSKALQAMDRATALCSDLENSYHCNEMKTPNCIDTELMDELFVIAREERDSLQARFDDPYKQWMARGIQDEAKTRRQRAEDALRKPEPPDGDDAEDDE